MARPTVTYDIENSKHTLELGKFKFHFSSEALLKRYLREYDSFLYENNLKLQYKYGLLLNFKDYFMLALYKKIEVRGFYVFYNNELLKEPVIECIIKERG